MQIFLLSIPLIRFDLIYLAHIHLKTLTKTRERDIYKLFFIIPSFTFFISLIFFQFQIVTNQFVLKMLFFPDSLKIKHKFHSCFEVKVIKPGSRFLPRLSFRMSCKFRFSLFFLFKFHPNLQKKATTTNPKISNQDICTCKSSINSNS